MQNEYNALNNKDDNDSKSQVTYGYSILKRIIEWSLYVFGAIILYHAYDLFFDDLDVHRNIYDFKEKKYVGGDAYNYMISASRSTAVMVKSLILTIVGCTAFIIGRLTALTISKK